ncbi:LamG-like jellyroll fold domain-containing protein [Polaribacter sp. Q13]|uniref:LamG-like jellyroll fold domain-containing protein n=1 Tax=Polaribacter sp. Q13 TaxID=2806551 RepID=UPI00193BCC20|nr:LamG-like jellyroll fold domain-containing protein [Polaribacter sp. Q13]QVY64215.1 T9SS type A sorting domain-containing protein [Polaribacter sp. Q13]
MRTVFINLIIILITFCSYAQTANDGLYFDGVDDYINVGGASGTSITNINSTTTNDRTYETWFKADALPGTPTVPVRQFIMKEGAGTRAVVVYIENDYLIVGAYNRNDYTPDWQGTFFRKKISAGTWYHVAMVLDNALAPNTTTNLMGANENTALKFYLDGALIGENSGYEVGAHNTMRLGYKDVAVRLPSVAATWTSQLSSEYFYASSTLNNYSGDDYFKGYLWGFRLWNRVRTPAEIDDYKADIITTVGTDDLVAILDGDTFTYLANDNTSTEEAIVSPVTTIIWSATAATTDWNMGSNWVGGNVPSILKKESAQIQVSSNYPEIATHIVVGDLIVDTGASITVNAGGTLEVTYDLTNDGTITVLDDASLVLREKEAPVSAGTFIIQKVTPTYASNKFYSYWSSPVVASDSNIATVFPDASLIYKFDAASSNSDWVSTGTADFNPGIGYAVRNESMGGQIRTFSGKINEGDIAVDIYNTTNLAGPDFDGIPWSLNGDNLVGNPYAAAIDWDLVITDPDNTEIEGTMYLWDQNSVHIGENIQADYLEYNMTGGASNTTTSNIGSGQGFFIKTTSENPNLKIIFKTTHQIAGLNTKFLRSSNNNNSIKKKGRSWFTFNHNDVTKSILIGFLEGATENFDRLYDAPFDVEKKSMSFYSIVEETFKATIQGLPELKGDTEVIKLGFIADEEGDYTIGIQEEQIDEAYYIYLLDTEKGITIDLKQKEYNFTIDTVGENNSRFKVVYSKSKLKTLAIKSNEIEAKELSVYLDGAKELVVIYNNSKDNIDEVSVFTVQGREVAFFKGSQKKNTSNLSSGVYLVKVKLQDGRTLNKKVLIAN